MDDDEADFEADLEAELLREMESAPAAPAPAPAPAAAAQRPPAKRSSSKRPRGGLSHGSDQLEQLAAVASAGAGASASLPPAEDGEGADDDAPGYMWGMNILTGKTRAEEEAEAAANTHVSAAADDDASERKRPRGKMVELRYGSYQGMQLSVAEVRRIKAEECRALLARRKLVRAMPSTARACARTSRSSRVRVRVRVCVRVRAHGSLVCVSYCLCA